MSELTEPYRPSDTYDRSLFLARFCDKCALAKIDVCPIEMDTLFFDVTHADYPKEWVRGLDCGISRCTAFISDAPADERTFLDV